MSDWLLMKNISLHLRMNTATGSLQLWWEIIYTSLTHNGLPTVWGPCMGWAPSQGHICWNLTTVWTGSGSRRICHGHWRPTAEAVLFTVPGWRKGTGAQEPHGSLCPTYQTGETFVQPDSQRLPGRLRHLGCLRGCCCIWNVLLNFLKPGLLNGDVDAFIMTRIK